MVTGTVPPAANGVSTIVVLEPNPPRQLPPSDVAAMDQVNRVFTPDILFARVGDAVEFHNSDDTLHNVNVTNDETKEQMFNVAIIPETVFKYTFAKEGLYDVHCDIHQTMAALIVASASPYAKLADPDGHVQFDDVAPGGYIARAYVGAGKVEQPIEVSGPRTEIALRN
jgi:plastocyanin